MREDGSRSHCSSRPSCQSLEPQRSDVGHGIGQQAIHRVLLNRPRLRRHGSTMHRAHRQHIALQILERRYREVTLGRSMRQKAPPCARLRPRNAPCRPHFASLCRTGMRPPVPPVHGQGRARASPGQSGHVVHALDGSSTSITVVQAQGLPPPGRRRRTGEMRLHPVGRTITACQVLRLHRLLRVFGVVAVTNRPPGSLYSAGRWKAGYQW